MRRSGRRLARSQLFVVVWVALLGASYGLRWTRPPSPLPEGMFETRIAGRAGAEAVRLAYRDSEPDAADDRPALLLLHGSPGSSDDFRNLAPALTEHYRLVIPDLPGFGASKRRADETSIAAHAVVARELLDDLGIGRAHVLGFSMGGGVAIELAGRSPQRIRSLTLLSAIGVQELELLGSYPLNHAVHGLQLGLLWVVHRAVPHFGLLDDSMLSVDYARNFYDSDQRPLRGLLTELESPVLILHGKRDRLVPVAAAREHHRIVPQSELVLHPRDHFEVFRRDSDLAEPVAEFLDRVESGRAVRRADAGSERLEFAGQPFDPGVVPRATGMTLLVFMVLLAAATLVSEDLTCIGAGLLVAQGWIGLVAAVVACMVGILVGDLLLFAAGRWLGRPWLRRPPLKWLVSSERVEAASRWFERRGAAVVLFSRFMPGARLPTYFAAGVLQTPFLSFLAWFTLAVVLWTPLLVGLSALAGEVLLEALEWAEQIGLPGFAAAALIVWSSVALLRSLLTWSGRRRLRGALCRWRHWEFWPPWLFYPPVVLAVLWLGLRHRSLTLFTAANPAMPAGGFIGESKTDILGALVPQDVARYRLLPAGVPTAERVAAVEDFLADEELALPVVLKPDVGERGNGVRIVRSKAEVEEYLGATPKACMVQEYVDGPELGIFYIRRPGAELGQIFSITDKRLPSIIGDGRSTLEQLILDDRRWVCMAPIFLRRWEARLADVPPAGERVMLGDLGTHCRGALFLDGRELATPALEAAIERVARSYPGFYFGRFDFRARSRKAFAEGRGLQVLELNGVTSEATHIYDPSTPLLDAYRVLFRQWSLAFEIGRANRDRGAEVTPAGTLLRDLLARG